MIKRYISLVELLCILAVTSVTGSLATKLFMEFIKQSQTLELRQQNQRDLTNIVRSLRIWAAQSSERIQEIDGLWFSGKNEIYFMNSRIVFKINGKEIENQIPKGYQIKLFSETVLDKDVICLNASKAGLSYSVKLKLEGKS